MINELSHRTTVTEVFGQDYVSKDVKRLQELDTLIEKTFRENHDPEYYSRKLNVSLRQLNRLVFRYHGKTVYQRLQDRIHREAEKLLKHTTLTTKEIAYELGLYDPAHFCKCFKRVSGMTPLEFRRENQMLVMVR